MKSLAWLLKPSTIIASIILGTLIGIFFKDFTQTLSPIGDLYLALLSMCILPLLFCAVSSSIAKLFSSKDASDHIRKIALAFTLGLLLVTSISVLTAAVSGLGTHLDESDRAVIGKLLAKTEVSKLDLKPSAEKSKLLLFLQDMIPSNILLAFTTGKSLSILFFSLLFGIAMGVSHTPASRSALRTIEGFYETLLTLVNGLMYGLPIGLIALFSTQISHMGAEMFVTLLDLTLAVLLMSAILISLFFLVIWKRSKQTLKQTYMSLRGAFLVAMATMSSFASIPAAISALVEKLNFRNSDVKLLIPLGTCLNPLGSCMLIGVKMVYMANLYQVPLDGTHVLLLISGTIAASIAMSGIPGIGALALMAIACQPLEIPLEPTIIITLAIVPVVEPFVTAVNVFGNMAMTAAVAHRDSGQIFDSQKAAEALIQATVHGEATVPQVSQSIS